MDEKEEKEEEEEEEEAEKEAQEPGVGGRGGQEGQDDGIDPANHRGEGAEAEGDAGAGGTGDWFSTAMQVDDRVGGTMEPVALAGEGEDDVAGGGGGEGDIGEDGIVGSAQEDNGNDEALPKGPEEQPAGGAAGDWEKRLVQHLRHGRTVGRPRAPPGLAQISR